MNLAKNIPLAFVAVLLSSCVRNETLPNLNGSESVTKPPAYVQKAWNARYKYDNDRRMLIPVYAGNRWGSVQQYKEDGSLEYLDWWVKDVKSEDLEPVPETNFPFLLDEDGNVTQLQTLVDDNTSNTEDSTAVKEEPFPFQNVEQDADLEKDESEEELIPFSPF